MYRIAVQLLEPFTFCWVGAFIGLLVLYRGRCEPCRAFRWFSAMFVVLTLICTPAFAHLVVGTLEWHYLTATEMPPTSQAIVVLGGALLSTDEGETYDSPAFDTLTRCIRAAKLYHTRPHLSVFASGGKFNKSLPGPTLAFVMQKTLVEQGVEREDVSIEDQSTTTYENALNTGTLLNQQGVTEIILVTDATHLLRAVLCFRKQGFKVHPVGCNFRTISKQWSLLDFVPNAQAANQTNMAAHEWLGLLWYRIHGRL